jgi:hypothetical protein
MTCMMCVQVVTRASAGVALGDALLRNLMDTSSVDLVFLEQEMQLMVKEAVLADVARDSGAAKTNRIATNKGSTSADINSSNINGPSINSTSLSLSQALAVDDEENEAAQSVPQTSFMSTIRPNPSVLREWPAPKPKDGVPVVRAVGPSAQDTTNNNSSSPSSSGTSNSSSSIAGGTVSESGESGSHTHAEELERASSSDAASSVEGASSSSSVDDSEGGLRIRETQPVGPAIHGRMLRGGAGAARVQVPPGGVQLGKRARSRERSSMDEWSSSGDDSMGVCSCSC